MKLIRIKAKQNMVNYKRPMCYLSGETFPLPPYSTIIGMIHTACGYKEYHPMKISIQGMPYSVVSDMQTKYAGGTAKFESGRHNAFAMCDGESIGYTKGPGNAELITEIDLVIHILPEREEELEEIQNSLLNPTKFLALGRHEDLLNITEAKKRRKTNISSMVASYKLKKVFKVDPKNNLRTFDEYYKVHYLSKGETLFHVFMDDEENVICLI